MVPGTNLNSQVLECIGTISQPRIIFRSVLPVRLNADPIIGNASIGRPRLFVEGQPPEPELEVDMRDRYADRIISTDDTVNLLITQYQVNSNMRGLDDQIQKVIDRNLVEPLGTLEDMRNIDLAMGAWLDYIGEKLDCPRPPRQAPGSVFGFEGSGNVGWNQRPFNSINPNLSLRVPVTDRYYRPLLKLCAHVATMDGSVADLNRAIQYAFPFSYYIDNADNTLNLLIISPDLILFTMMDDNNLWPRPAGMSLTIITLVLLRSRLFAVEGNVTRPTVYAPAPAHLGIEALDAMGSLARPSLFAPATFITNDADFFGFASDDVGWNQATFYSVRQRMHANGTITRPVLVAP